MALVVVAEDDDDIRGIILLVLRRGGHTVVVTRDGAEGLLAVREHRPDVLVSDIDMPVMSGVELCRAVRADPELSTLPVIFVSGSLLPGDPRPQEAEVTALLPKPFIPRELLSCLEKVLAAGHRPRQAPISCP
jgi:CheY-like chemotaxis protein